ncbi:hypothetical protein BT93_K0026 [Corymbia citriodora subsp. variegata]|nr:hypothetical protein BT93_K0026 [Corymbia citriodora subsp. variegata]
MGLSSGDMLKFDQGLTSSGGYTEVHIELKTLPNHGQYCCGTKEALVGFGNFGEIGPLDENLQPRNFTWLQKADLLFVDSPVATGFSYVEDESLVVKTDYKAAVDLTTLLVELFNGDGSLQKSPLYIFAESYGGKFASALGVTALESIEAGKLKAQLGGVALGDSWISPEDFVFSWGPVLKVMSRIDEIGLNQSDSLALKIQQELAEGKSKDATGTWYDLEQVILQYSNNVDFYNFMLDDMSDSAAVKESRIRSNRYMERTSTGAGAANSVLGNLMNGPIRKKLEIIPDNVTWQGQGGLVFPAFHGEFMKPRIEEAFSQRRKRHHLQWTAGSHMCNKRNRSMAQ